MGDLTKNISSHEVECKCGNSDCTFTILPHEPVLQLVQDACDYFAGVLDVDKVTCIIHSGARCTEYNRRPIVGSNDNSQHTRARAIDFHIEGVPTIKLYDYLDAVHPGRCGLGLYPTFVHVDDRPIKARWGRARFL